MKVFKFGGASVKNAQAVRNTGSIIANFNSEPLLVVISAMGKTTNALELVVKALLQKQNTQSLLDELIEFHSAIIRDLLSETKETELTMRKTFHSVENLEVESLQEDQLYDQVVALGELVSTKIVHAHLMEQKLAATWLDARNFIATDSTYREGKIDWQKTKTNIEVLDFVKTPLVITQGFIGSDENGFTTTLGREGSDFSAAIFASCLHAESVTIWKDVPGVMNADPKRLAAAVVFNELPFKEAAEMTYYGASVIHPKTIKPLANAGIPLLVKNFDDPSLPGTRIHECKVDEIPPLIVFKDNQCLISCKVTDYSFVSEEQLSIIFRALSELDIKINLMQNSAISFSFCVDFRENKVLALIEKLQHHFEVYYNTGLTLITIKNYDEKLFDFYRKQPGVLLEQSSRSTLQVLTKQ